MSMLSLVCGHGEAKVVEKVALGMVEVAGKLTAFMIPDVAAAKAASMDGEWLTD